MTRRLVPILLVAMFAGCAAPAVEEEYAPEPSVLIDPDRPAPEAGQVVTGPAVEPDLNATTAAAPRLVPGEWWRIRFSDTMSGDSPELVRVVAATEGEGYIIGMPHEGWIKEAISFHSPAFGDVGLDLSYNTHNLQFQPVQFPLEKGNTWQTTFATAPLTAVVEEADQYTATIAFYPEQNDDPMTLLMMTVLGMGGDGPSMVLTYDARMHEVVKFEGGLGNWEVVEHGYDFQGWVTVPRGEHTAIDYGSLPLPADPSRGQIGFTQTINVDGGFNRMTLMHMIAPLGPGSYRITSTPPDGDAFVTESSGGAMSMKFYEAYNPDGRWVVEDLLLGPGVSYSMGIAYHQYDISLPDGARRADHAHPVIR